MKKFFEDYGKTIIIILIVLVLLFLVPQIGANVKENILGTPVVEPDFSLNSGTVDVAKGDLITIDSKEYRVLSVNGTEAKLLAMYDATKMAFNGSTTTTLFGEINGIQYAGFNLDNYLENEFYLSLSFKDAIIEQNISQNMYQYGQIQPTSGTYYTSWTKSGFTSTDTSGDHPMYITGDFSSVSIGIRHVYVLDVKDVLEYLDYNLTPQSVNTMFWDVDHSIDSSHTPYWYAWLRSASAIGPYQAWTVDGRYGNLNTSTQGGSFGVRPAFVIDLTKCEYTK